MTPRSNYEDNSKMNLKDFKDFCRKKKQLLLGHTYVEGSACKFDSTIAFTCGGHKNQKSIKSQLSYDDEQNRKKRRS